jgi:endonuclease YncB( thermonuclease family)
LQTPKIGFTPPIFRSAPSHLTSLFGSEATRLTLFLLTAVALFSAAPLCHAQDLIGRASVIDGDTIEIHGQRIRLFGIDAPEHDQLCEAGGNQYRCGQQAALALSDQIGSKSVDCVRRDVDQYGRVVAVCSAGGEDLNAWMVRHGWALAYRHYSTAYGSDEVAAHLAGVGIWRGTFDAPWDWRRGLRQGAAPVESQGTVVDDRATGQCIIKGNISSKGERIYHLPGGEYYDATKVDTSKGERWFCTEADAVAAGWRRSKL